jgi:MFS family permease
VFIMSGATLGMGLARRMRSGAASALMVTLRLIQGFCLGGELPGALTYVVETAPRIAPLVCGVVFACVTMGVALATGVSLSVRTFLDPALVPEYGWRIAFILGGLGGVLSFVLRRSLEESPEFARMKSFAVRQPFLELLRTNLVHVLVGCAILAGTGCFNGLFFSHLPVFHRPSYDSPGCRRRSGLRSAIGILATGWLGDRIPPRYLLRTGVALLLVPVRSMRARIARSISRCACWPDRAGLTNYHSRCCSRICSRRGFVSPASRCSTRSRFSAPRRS